MAKGMYIGVKEENPIYEGDIFTIDNTNISEYFTISNGDYGFIWNDDDNAFSSNNGGVASSTATSTWTALKNMTISFSYSYSSESNYDKFYLTIAGTTIENAVSGSTTIKSWSGDILAGQTIVMKYTKDSSSDRYDDKCKIYDINSQVKIGINVKETARKIRKAYIGVETEVPYYPDILIDNTNISEYFTISNGDYGFIWNDDDNAFSSNNGGVASSTATSTWTALKNIMNVTFKYSYSSESSFDKFYLTIAGTTIENAVSGSTTIKSWSGDILAGQTIVMKYTKDSSSDIYDDKCKIYDISFISNISQGTVMKNIARKIKKAYIGVNGLARQIYPKNYTTMTVNINTSNSNPNTCIAYSDDAIGMTSGSSEWDSFFGHYPCLLKKGFEVGRLNKNNFSKFDDNSNADISSGNLGDVMISFPILGYKISTSGNILTVSMTDNPNAEGYCYLAHTRGNTVKDKFYLGAYEGYVSSNRLRSISGKRPTVNNTISSFRTYAQNNGNGYDQFAFNQLTFIQCMYLLKYKNLNSQTALGYGFANLNDGSFHYANTGSTNMKGMDYGESSGKYQMKLFGLEDLWGNRLDFIDGILIDSNRNILTSTDSFNNEGNGYTNQGYSGFSSDSSLYISSVQGTSQKGFLLKGGNGSSSTYFCDRGTIYASNPAIFGGSFSDGLYSGIFALWTHRSFSYSDSYITSRLMYL